MTNALDHSPPPLQPPRQRGILLGLVFRLLLLMVGGAIAGFTGVAIAHFYPASTPEKPLLETVLRRSKLILKGEGTPQETKALAVTLPSDVFFKDSQSALRPGTNAILDNIISDLRNYPGATILVAVHTDNLGEVKDNQELSFRQAQAVKQYLATHLGSTYHWLVAGYGAAKPVVENTTDANRQRNRRIEIAVDPN
ncbi:MAG: OmpA family protein [Leptolyngbyaceae bacterium]|nr:OmpA family protein [Leptolyngbyaceae bacterium]